MKEFEEISGRNPFKVPENYFEEVNRKIIASTVDSKEVLRSKGLISRLRPWIAAAASLALLIMLSYTALRILKPTGREASVPEISFQEFYDNYFNDIDIITLEENIDPIALYDKMPEVNKSEIIDYLMLENIDINEIYEML